MFTFNDDIDRTPSFDYENDRVLKQNKNENKIENVPEVSSSFQIWRKKGK